MANDILSFHGWYRVAGAGREVLCSRYGTGYNNQFNHITDPNGIFHWNSTGVSCSAGDCTPGAYTHNEWAYISWQYTTANGGTMEWYVNGILVWRVTSVGTNGGMLTQRQMESWDFKPTNRGYDKKREIY